MLDLSTGSVVLVVVASLFTAIAAIWDLKSRRIPNKLTLPVFAAGWVFQAIDRGWAGLGDAGLGFLLGFGILFVLWIVGGGGGGDVKLMGALSVWLGFRLTLLVMIASTGLVLLTTGLVLVYSLVTGGIKASRKKYLATGKASAKELREGKELQPETVAARKERRILPFAVPVALATWLILAWKLPTLDNPVRGMSQPAEAGQPAGQPN
ncbi:MAG: A24 family peptidase [Planctomycetaceae bacterium]